MSSLEAVEAASCRFLVSLTRLEAASTAISRRDDGGHRRIAFFRPRPFRPFGRLYLATRAATLAFLLLPRAANRRLADQANGHAPLFESLGVQS